MIAIILIARSITPLSECLNAGLGSNCIPSTTSDSWNVQPNSPVPISARKYAHFSPVNRSARFLISFKAGYTSFMLFVLSSLTYTIRLALHETTRKYLKPRTNAKQYLDKSAYNLLTLLPSRLSVFLLNNSFILPAKHGLQSFSPFSYFLLSFSLIKPIELLLSN